MAKNLGITFTIGASLGSTVSSAFASVQNKLKATQAAFRLASNQSRQIEKAAAARQRRDFAAQQAKKQLSLTGHIDASLRKELAELSRAYMNAAKAAGVYGQSLEQIQWRQKDAEARVKRSERSLAALQMVQRGRDSRSEQTQVRRTAISNAFADLAPFMSLAAPLKTGMEFDAAMSKVSAISGATGADFENLRSQARQLGASTVWSAKEAAEGMSFLAMAGFKTNEVMAAMPGMLSLASAGGMDLASTADIASNILTGFGKNASEMTRVGDILAKTFTSSNTSIASRGESFKYCAPVAANAGQSFESVAAMIGKLGDAGIQGSMAGTGLNAIIGRMAAAPKEATDAMKKLGVRIADSKGKMRPLEDVFAEIQSKMAKFSEQEQISLAKALYGAEHFAKGFVLQIAASDGSLQKLRDSLKAVDVYSDRVASMQNDNLIGDFRQLNSAMQEVSICLTEVVTPPLRQLMANITPVVQGIGRWISANPRLVQGLMLLGGGLVALKTAGLAFTLLNSYLKSFGGALVSMQGQAMRPIAMVRNGLSGLRMALAQPLPGGSFSGTVSQGITKFKSRIDSLRQSFGRTIQRMREFNGESLKSGLAGAWAGAKAAASGARAATGRAGWNLLRLGVHGVGMAFRSVFSPMNLLIMGMTMGVDYIISNWDKIAPYFQALWENVKSIFSSVMNWLQPIFDAIGNLFDPFLEKIKGFGNIVGGMLEKLGKAWDWFAGNDTENERKAKAEAENRRQKQEHDEIKSRLPNEVRAALEPGPPGLAVEPVQAGVSPAKEIAPEPARKQEAASPPIAVAPAGKIAVPTLAQAQTAASESAQTATLEKKPAKSAKPAQKAASEQSLATPQPQIIQPQVQVAVNVTQNGIPDAQFATGVMNAIRARQAELERMISAIVNEQARLAYG